MNKNELIFTLLFISVIIISIGLIFLFIAKATGWGLGIINFGVLLLNTSLICRSNKNPRKKFIYSIISFPSTLGALLLLEGIMIYNYSQISNEFLLSGGFILLITGCILYYLKERLKY